VCKNPSIVYWREKLFGARSGRGRHRLGFRVKQSGDRTMVDRNEDVPAEGGAACSQTTKQ